MVMFRRGRNKARVMGGSYARRHTPSGREFIVVTPRRDGGVEGRNTTSLHVVTAA